jgi:16S rRNA (uracil1498-N3)-methyltransferase
MHIPRFFAYGSDLDTLKQLDRNRLVPGSRIELAEDDLIKRLRSVLRLGQGQEILLLDGEGLVCHLVIEALEKSLVVCRLASLLPADTGSGVCVRLGLSLIKTQRFEWCLEKLTELGVSEIVPLVSARCVVRSAPDVKGHEGTTGKQCRWQAIVREAAEQSERLTIPPVVKAQTLEHFLSCPTSGGITELRFICAERRQAAPLVKALTVRISGSNTPSITSISTLSLLVGPEGGFTDFEITRAQEQGWEPVTLGSRILRSETAAIAAMSQVASVLDIRECKFH